MLEAALRRKIEELIASAQAGSLVPREGILRDTKHAAECRGWITEALNVIERVVPIENNAYRRQATKIAESGNLVDQVASIGAILRGLLSDVDAGLVADFGNCFETI
jgi:hypothetical protein